MMMYAISVLIIAVIYIALLPVISIGNALVAFFWGVFITLLIKPTKKSVTPGSIIQRSAYLLLYLALLLVDMIRSGIEVAVIVLTPSLPINPGIIAIDTDCHSDLAKALNAHSLTITPGELVVEIGENGTMYTHVLDVNRGNEMVEASRRRRRNLLQKIVL